MQLEWQADEASWNFEIKDLVKNLNVHAYPIWNRVKSGISYPLSILPRESLWIQEPGKDTVLLRSKSGAQMIDQHFHFFTLERRWPNTLWLPNAVSWGAWRLVLT